MLFRLTNFFSGAKVRLFHYKMKRYKEIKRCTVYICGLEGKVGKGIGVQE
jgi:hypothetical protein